MNRRVLLIDADIAFRDTLIHELGKYRVVVMCEPEADRALALANADAPALIVLDIEEAEKKAGFRVFEKCKKGSLSRVPIILVTGSVPPESFAKHRGLKVHADEYIDKRTMSTHELVGKIDGLISLGEPAGDDDLSIPVEDEIPMEIADGDVVLDEVVADDQSNEDFADPHEMRTVGPNDGFTVNQMVEAETDAAFDMLMDEHEPRPQMLSRPPQKPEPEVAVAGVVPEPIHDGRGRGTTPPPILQDSVPGIIHDQPPDLDSSQIGAPINADATDDDPATAVQSQDEQVAHVHSSRYESSPAIMLDDDELVPLDDDTQAASPRAVAASLHDAATVARPVESGVDDLREPIFTDSIIQIVKPEPPAPSPALDAVTARPAPLPEPKAPLVAPGKPVGKSPSGSHPAIDLGLDTVARDAAEEQSGVYDRRALRKIGELERQIAQLKIELDRARAAGEAAAKGATGGSRESQFLNLRESMLAKEKEIKQVKTDLVTRDQELAEAKERLRQAQHAKTTLEQKNNELETKLVDDSGKATQLASQVRTAQAQIQTLQQELDSIGNAQATAEQARAQLERDLANERATGKASASEAERLLRVEREQLLARHKNELGALRSEVSTAQELAVAQLREELETAHGEAVLNAVEEVRRANAAEHTEAIAALDRQHASELVALKAEHAGEHGRLRNELGNKISELEASVGAARAAHADAVSAAEAVHAEALAAATAEHAQLVAAAHAAGHEAVQGAAAEQERALANQRTEHSVAIEELRRGHADELGALKSAHAVALTAREEELDEQREREVEAHGRALADLKAERDSASSAHAQAVAAAAQERDELLARHEQTVAGAMRERDELHAHHEQLKAELVVAHQQELARMKDAHEELADAARRAGEQHRAALAEAETKHAGELSQVAESAGREVAEHKAAAAAARRIADDAAAQVEAERAAATTAVEQARSELEAKQERALALANGEFLKQKSVADAEHAKALAAHHAEAQKTQTELAAERDELRRGLSSARDNLKRSEGELASAVQSIADRNAELRAHAGAIAERDQRIADLRKEIEALETENASYQEQVLRAYQKIKTDEAMVARARKAMAIALTVLDDQGNPKAT